MAGISSTLSISKTAIATQQYGLNITGQNISNVNNPNYSVQNADHISRKPVAYAGFLFGTGVDMNQVEQRVDQLLEARLNNEQSTQASFEQQESYMRVLEGFFDENSDTSITTVLTEFWNAWHDISDNPQGSSERVAVFESGAKLASRLEASVLDMDGLLIDINADIRGAVQQVNELTKKIADLNQDVLSAEIYRTANDQRDQRNALVKELGQIMDIKTIQQGNGALVVTAANGYSLVNGVDTYSLSMSDDRIVWQGSAGSRQDITDKIDTGRIGGLLEMRDAIVPKYQAEANELAREMIWAVNYQHSQGAGLEYFNEPVTGDYAVDDSGWLTSFEFGDKIDFTKDFTMWTEDQTQADTQYNKIQMDMGISEARITNWDGVAPSGAQSIYRLTVLDEAVLGDREVMESDGDGLAMVQVSNAGGADALDQAIAEQTLTVYDGPSGTSVIEVKDVGGDAKRSAAAIAEALSKVDGVEAYASETSASLELINNAINDGDEIQYSLYVDGVIQEQRFIRDASAGNLEEQFENSLLAAAQAVNQINEDKDLYVEGGTITSSSGRTLGLQDFEVQDNAGIRLDSFAGFNAGDTISFTVDAVTGAAPVTVVSSTDVSVDLNGVDTSDQVQMASVFSEALSTALADKDFSVTHDPSTSSVVIRTTDGSDIRLENAANDTGDDARIDIAALSGSTSDAGNTNDVIDFDPLGTNTARFNAVTSTADELNFSTGSDIPVTLGEVSAGGIKSAVITGTVTMVTDPGMSIRSSVSGAGTGGLFDANLAKKGSSILTLGGEGGFSGFTTTGGETISFDLDGHAVSFNTTAGAGTTDRQLAELLRDEIIADLPVGVSDDYQVILTGSSVSVIKATSLEAPITIGNFEDTDGSASNGWARIAVRTGTGKGTNQPENNTLWADPAKSHLSSTTSTLYDDEGIILWERLDKDGLGTGASGLLSVEDEGRVEIVEKGVPTLSFDISAGSLVAGNTLTLNTDTSGRPDPLDFRITGRANSINDLYQFKVVSGGKVGHLPEEGEEPLEIFWSNSVTNGTFTIEGHDPPYTPETPVEVLVDGMNFKFSDGTLFTDDVFTVTTGDTGLPLSKNTEGYPTGETLSDWHWTLDSFAGQFNRVGQGMKASTTLDNRLKFGASPDYYTVDNMQYSERNGFSEDNVSIRVTDWSAINFKAADLQFQRSGDGTWGVLKDPTGGKLQILPAGGDDDGFAVDFSGDGLADIKIDFTEPVTGNGFVAFDFTKRDAGSVGFAFSDDATADAGLAAAAGINTFFEGRDAMTMEINETLKDTKRVAAATIDSTSGAISKGDNTNALGLADVQFQDKTLKIWTFARGKEAASNTTTATLDNYFNTIVGSMGISSRSIKNARSFADIMVTNITEQRDALSAVSLDEEMIQLMRYQHAFSAASKLLTVSDEMLNTLISVR